MLVQRRRDKRAALLAHAQAPQETGLHAEITDDRQAGLLWSRPLGSVSGNARWGD
jgi:hypothetical protein